MLKSSCMLGREAEEAEQGERVEGQNLWMVAAAAVTLTARVVV